MRRLAIALAIAAAVTPAAASADSLTVNLDQAARITLARPIHDVIVGNPGIVDATVLDAHHLAILGKGYGITNVMAMDAGGRIIYSRQVVISEPDVNHIALYRGPDIYNFACSPHCERTALPGERSTTYEAFAPPDKDYAARQKSANEAASQGSSAP